VAAEPPQSDNEEATPQQTEEPAPEDVAAPTVLPDILIGPTAADRLAIAEQHVKTLAEKSKSGYLGRLKTFQVCCAALLTLLIAWSSITSLRSGKMSDCH
jgi:hypothetical protein